MEEQLSNNYDIDSYLSHLENLSSRIADNISLGQFGDVTKLDIERKVIINKISQDASNLNSRRKSRLKLIWVNNKKMINELEDKNSFSKKKYSIHKKTLVDYTKN